MEEIKRPPHLYLVTKDQEKVIKTRSDNPKLKQPFQKINYTEEQLAEYIKCKRDILYFADNYFYNVTIDGGLTKIKLWDFQREVLQAMFDERYIVINSSRQIGKSMLYSIFCCHCMIFGDYKKIALLANKGDSSRGILNEKIKVAYEHLPIWMQQGVTTLNVGSIDLENHSSIKAYATTPDSVRSISCNVLICDEAAIIRDNLWAEFARSSFPTISAGKTSKIFIVSTPKGYNFFYDIVANAKLGKNKFRCFEFMWDVRPDRDEDWKNGEIALFGEDYFLQEYCHSFIGVKGTLVRGSILKKIIDDVTDNDYELNIKKLKRFKDLEKYFKNIRIYKQPTEDHTYIISCDSATNTDEMTGDSASIQILDVTELPFVQVGVVDFIDDTSYLEIPFVQVALAKIYNNAMIFNENNEGAGREANITISNEIGYENVYWQNKIAGYRTDVLSKSKGCANLKNAIEHGYIKLYDKITLYQLNQFGKKKNSYKAINGLDDAVMALIGCLYFLQLSQGEFDDLFKEKYIPLPPLSDVLKLIHTTVNDRIDESVVETDEGIEFKNKVLNEANNRISLNDLIDTIGNDPIALNRVLNKEKQMVRTIKGHEAKNDLMHDLFIKYDDDDDEVKNIDDLIFGD